VKRLKLPLQHVNPSNQKKKPVLFIEIFLLQEWPVLPRDTPRNPQSVPGDADIMRYLHND
jgi:hypothetical protein